MKFEWSRNPEWLRTEWFEQFRENAFFENVLPVLCTASWSHPASSPLNFTFPTLNPLLLNSSFATLIIRWAFYWESHNHRKFVSSPKVKKKKPLLQIKFAVLEKRKNKDGKNNFFICLASLLWKCWSLACYGNKVQVSKHIGQWLILHERERPLSFIYFLSNQTIPENPNVFLITFLNSSLVTVIFPWWNCFTITLCTLY